MDVYQTEHEQGEALKKWLRENGAALVSGVLLGLALLYGGKAWLEYGQRRAEQASEQYYRLLGALDRDDQAAALESGGLLIQDYSATPYAASAALVLARIQLERGEPAAARVQLEWALEHAGLPEQVHVARLRLARLLIATDEAAAAERLLDGVDGGAFTAAYEELRGDLYLDRGERARAHEAYQRALDTLAGGEEVSRILLEAKRDYSAVAAPEEEPRS